MSSIQEKIRLLKEAQDASNRRPQSYVPPPPVLPAKLTESSPTKLVSVVDKKEEVTVQQTPKPAVEVKSQPINNARKMFEEMANKNKQPMGIPLKPVVSTVSEPTKKVDPPKVQPVSSRAESTTIKAEHTSVGSQERLETVGTLPTFVKTESNLIVQPIIVKPSGMFHTAQPRKIQLPQPNRSSQNVSNQPPSVDSGPAVFKPSQMKANQAFMEMLGGRIGKPMPPPRPIQPPVNLETEGEKRDKFIVDRLFSQNNRHEGQHHNPPGMAVQAFANVLHIQPPGHVSDTIADTFTNILHPPVQQPTNAITSEATREELNKEADEVITRGGAAKKNKKKKVQAFEDM